MDAFDAVSVDSSPELLARKFFTVAEANKALPLVQRIVADIVRDYSRLLSLREECQSHDARGNPVEAEFARQQYVAVADRLSELNEELEKIGCELKDYQMGLVDFPGMKDGREVCLCWKLGEEAVEYWHDVAAGFPGREAIPSDMH